MLQPPTPKEIDLDLGPKFVDMYTSIYNMRQDLDKIRKPVGTKENPGRSCKDLHYGHPQFADGMFLLPGSLRPH